MHKSILIKGGSILGEAVADLLIRDGKIAEIAPSISSLADVVIDATGSVVLPGFVDLHTHLREPGRENSETIATGSLAAARGGYVAVSAMANTLPVADSAAIVEQVASIGKSVGLVDVFRQPADPGAQPVAPPQVLDQLDLVIAGEHEAFVLQLVQPADTMAEMRAAA